MDKIIHVIKRNELPCGAILEQAVADFINSIPADLFSFDKIEITDDEAIIEYHMILVKLMGEPASSFNQAVMESLKDDPQPSNLIDISVKPTPLPADMQGRVAEYHQAVMECLKDPSVDGLMAYHRLVAGPDELSEKEAKKWQHRFQRVTSLSKRLR